MISLTIVTHIVIPEEIKYVSMPLILNREQAKYI